MPIEYLTDKRVQGLRCTDQRRLEVRDGKVPGLVLRVTPRGIKSWSVQYRLKGHSRTQRKTLGAYPAISISRARRLALEVVGCVAAGQDPLASERAAKQQLSRNSLTFDALLGEYIERRSEVVSIKEIERELRKDALPKIGRLRAADIRPSDIDGIAQTVLRRGSPIMARRLIDNIKALYNYCIYEAPQLAERYELNTNPAERLGRRRRGAVSAFTSRPRSRVLSDDEIRAWWSALSSSAMPNGTRIALKLVLLTAQRPGEVRTCRAERLHLEGSQPYWTLLEGDTKSRRRHIVPLSTLATQLFRDAIGLGSGEGVIFQDRKRAGEPISKVVLPASQRTLFKKHLPDYEPATVHDLRRSAATGMRRLGVAPHVVSQILNHARTDITGRVYDLYDGQRERREALGRWAEHISGLCTDETPSRRLADCDVDWVVNS